jgi:hypothetical protein
LGVFTGFRYSLFSFLKRAQTKRSIPNALLYSLLENLKEFFF